MPQPCLKLEIVVAPRLAVPASVPRVLRRAAREAYAHLPEKFRVDAAATLMLTGDAAVRRLNRDFRGQDRATNVLSFPHLSPREISGAKKAQIYLGDIAIACPYALAEAKKNNTIPINHLRHLVIHGLLHLFGYDHAVDREATRMERMETDIMAALGLPDPYADPGADPGAPPLRRGTRLKSGPAKR